MASKQMSPTPIRLPDELKLWIKGRADANLRSVNAEIVAILLRERETEKAGISSSLQDGK
jgi:hypothetical protein